MKRKLELLIIFLLISLCFTIILFCKHIELKIVNKSLNQDFNNLFEYLYYDELNRKEKIKIEEIDYEEVENLNINNINLDKNKISYKLVTDKISKNKITYKLIETNLDLYTLKEFFKDSNINTSINYNEHNTNINNGINIDTNYKNILKLSTKKASKFDVDRKVLNFNDKVGFYFNKKDELKEIEVYDKVNVFNTYGISNNKLNELSNFNDIIEYLGKGTLLVIDEGRYHYYTLMYKFGNVIIKFLSFYEDGTNNLCIISSLEG